MKRKEYDKSIPLLPVEGSPVLGESYHVSWATNGVMGVCTGINEAKQLVVLSRPKTMEPFAKPVSWKYLRHTRKQQQRIEEGKSPYADHTNDERHQKRMRKFNLL